MRKLIIAVSCLLCLSYTSKNDFRKGKQQLENMGYTDVERTGYKAFCCSDDDSFATGFKAKDKNGNPVSGCFCSALFKGVTIRFE